MQPGENGDSGSDLVPEKGWISQKQLDDLVAPEKIASPLMRECPSSIQESKSTKVGSGYSGDPRKAS